MLASSEQAQVIRVGLADRDVVKVKLGDKARVKFDAYPNEVFEAVVSEIAESADPRTTTFEVEIQMMNPQKPLKKGFVGKVNIIPSQGNKGYKIPMGALVEADKKQAFIYIPDAQHQKALKVTVNTSKIGRDYLIVNFPEGQKPAREVIVDGASYLEDQARIKVIQSKKAIARK
jgi:multidrug efflux pump subunit AcrA (membrane-fusion protein)